MHVINAFEIDDKILLKPRLHPEIVSEIRDYYNINEHRIETSPDEFERVKTILESYSYEPVLVEDITEYCIAVQQERGSRARRVLNELLATHLYDPIPVASQFEYRDWKDKHCKYEGDADVVYEREIESWTVRVMTDRSAVERAIAGGAKPLAEAGLDSLQGGSPLGSRDV